MDASFFSSLAVLKAGGIFIYPLFAVGLVAVGCSIDRFYVFWRQGALPRILARRLENPHFDWAELLAALSHAPSHSGFVRFFRVIVENSHQPVWWIETRAGDEAAQLERSLDQGLWVLETAVTAAPLLGLLGTIAGMVGAFRLFGDNNAVDPGKVTGGVAEALIATAIGIVIALVALASFNFFSHRRSILLDEMERLGSRLIDRIRLDREQPEGAEG